MSYLLAFANERWTVATDRCVIPAGEVPVFQDALALVAHVETIADSEAQRVQDAVEAGYRDGFEQGRQAGQAQAQRDAADTLSQVVARITQQAQAEHVKLHGAVTDVIGVVLRMVMAALPPAQLMSSLIARALQSVDPEVPVTVVLHPDIAVHVRDTLLAMDRTKMVVESNIDMDLFGCEVMTPTGRLLAGLEDQLAAVQSTMREARVKSESVGPAVVEEVQS